MGTSKGYIAPTTPAWATAKRNVSAYLQDQNEVTMTNAVSSYATAMGTGGGTINRASHSFAKAAEFLTNINSLGFGVALRELGCENLLSLSPTEAVEEFISILTDYTTIDDGLIADSMEVAFKTFQVGIEEDFDVKAVVKLMICEFAERKFAQLFGTHISNKCPNVPEADARLKEMQKYIYGTMESVLTKSVLPSIDIRNLAQNDVISQVMQDGYKFMVDCYGE